jgi:hypothetical protein
MLCSVYDAAGYPGEISQDQGPQVPQVRRIYVLRTLCSRHTYGTAKTKSIPGNSEIQSLPIFLDTFTSGCQCLSRNSPGLDPSILRHSVI